MEKILSRSPSMFSIERDFKIKTIDKVSLQKFDSLITSILRRVQASIRHKSPVNKMVVSYPNIIRRIILNALILEGNHPTWDEHILKTRSSFGLPEMPYKNLKSALNGMNGDAKNGDFNKLPSWIPIQAYVMGGRQDSSFFNKTIVGDYSNLPKEFSKQISEYLFQKKWRDLSGG